MTGLDGRSERHVPLFVVTGASSGIGRALASALAERGCEVLAVARRGDLLDSLRADSPHRIRALVADLEDSRSARDVIEAMPTARGVDGLVHCAGVGEPLAQLLDLSEEQWRRFFSVHVDAPLRLTKALATRLSGGRVLFIGSDSATRPRKGWSAYCVSKSAVAMLWQCLKLELEPMGIAVGIAKPGAVDTPLLRAVRDASVALAPDSAEIRRLYAEGDVATPETAAAFLSHLLLDVDPEAFSSHEWDRRLTTL